MNNIGYNDAKKIAEEIGKDLVFPENFVIDKKCKVIEFLHGDGTYCKINSACFVNIEDDWIAIYTEHHGNFIYHKDDLKWVRESKNPNILYYNKS